MMNWCNLARFEKNGPYTKGCGDMAFRDDKRHGIVGQCFLAPCHTKHRTHKKDDKWLQACRRLGWSRLGDGRDRVTL